MNKLNLFQQIIVGLWAAGLSLVIQAVIWNFKYIWTIEFGNKWFWKAKKKIV